MLGLALAAAGCGGGDAPWSVRLELGAAGAALSLDGAPLDPSYRALYPNPRGVTSLDAVLTADGAIAVTCRGAARGCGDAPFFSRVELVAGARRIQLRDVYGVLLVDEVVADPCSDAGGRTDEACTRPGDDDVGAPGDDDGAGSTDDVGGGDGAGSGGEADGPAPGDPAGGPGACPAPPTGGDCAALRAWARDCLCRGLQDNLDAYGTGYTFDCDHLDDPPTYEPPSTDYDGDLACENDLVEPVADPIDDVIDETDCWEVEVDLNNWSNRASSEYRSEGICGHSPLVLDLAGDGVALGAVSRGVSFDLIGDGHPVQCGWLAGADDALLVLDRNGNGTVDGAAELFGTATDQRAFADGFAALAELDADGDGRVDDGDPAFAALRLWRDPDRDGVGRAAELEPLAAAGVRALDLAAARVSGPAAWDGHGNRVPLRAQFERAGGGAGLLVDAYLRYEPSREAQDAELTRALLRRLLGI